MTNGGKQTGKNFECLQGHLSCSVFSVVFVWFVGFYPGDFSKNKQILNRNETATKKDQRGAQRKETSPETGEGTH